MTDQVLEIKRAGGVARIALLSGDVLKAPSAVYLERKLRPGQAVDPAEYRAFIASRGYPHALEIAVKYLALRERSQGEIVSRLRRSCYDERTIAAVMEKLMGHDLVSDARFAETWTQKRSRKYGRNRIAQELHHKGVDGDTIKTALNTLPAADEMDAAIAQAQKLARRMDGDSRKVIQALLRRGYAYSVARRAAETACHARAEE